jgi:hypothetical protein
MWVKGTCKVGRSRLSTSNMNFYKHNNVTHNKTHQDMLRRVNGTARVILHSKMTMRTPNQTNSLQNIYV